MRPKSRTILVIGADSGFGRALAGAFHASGHRVIAAGNRRPRLAALAAAHPGLRAEPLGGGTPAGVDGFAARIAERFPEIDTLVHAAGADAQEAADPRALRDEVLGTIRLTAALLPTLRRRKGAAILAAPHFPSARAVHPFALATRHFLRCWLDSLRDEVAGTPVRVVELAPAADWTREAIRLLDGAEPAGSGAVAARLAAVGWEQGKPGWRMAAER